MIDLTIRPDKSEKEKAVIVLWQSCGLAVSWDDSRRNIERQMRKALKQGHCDFALPRKYACFQYFTELAECWYPIIPTTSGCEDIKPNIVLGIQI